MKRNYKILFLAVLISLPLWWGVNAFAQKIENIKNQKESLTINNQVAKIEKTYFSPLDASTENLFPIKKQGHDDFSINSLAAISMLLKENGGKRILFEKNIDKKLPIASLTKIMTAILAIENNPDLSKIIEINEESARIDNEYGKGTLKISEKLSIENLLQLLLVESNNGAAIALALDSQDRKFLDSMNLKAVELGLEHTFFMNPNGLDPDKIEETHNYSSARDIANLSLYALKKYPLIWEIGKNKEYNIYLPDGTSYQHIKNTNELLSDHAEISGKTGWTPLAGGCLVVIYKAPNGEYLVNVVLGSANRFEDMKNLMNWLQNSFAW